MFQPKENSYAHLNDLKLENVFDESEQEECNHYHPMCHD